MNMFYVKDNQLVKYFASVSDVVSFLEKVVIFKTNEKRTIWMQHIKDLGHGEDDSYGRAFIESMQQFVEIGVVKNNKLVRCNIVEATVFQKPEYGN